MRTVVIVLFDGVQSLDVTGPLEVFAGANRWQSGRHHSPAGPWLSAHGPRARRLVSVCTGAFLLAEAGLLDRRRVTTHWVYCATLAARFPEITVDPDPIFVTDGHVTTSAGVTAGIDLALALVGEVSLEPCCRLPPPISCRWTCLIPSPSSAAWARPPAGTACRSRRSACAWPSWSAAWA